MTAELSTTVSTKHSEKPLAVSVREKSTSDLTTAIRSEADKTEIDAVILERANTVINLGYTPNWTPKERAEVLDAFRRSLRDLPLWAVRRAFSEWERTNPRRPSPAEIVTLAKRQLSPITDEIARRRKMAEEQAEAAAARKVISQDRAAEILAEAGFDPERNELVKKFPQSRSLSEARAKDEQPEERLHWTERADPEGESMAALQRARAENPIIKQARAAAERRQAEAAEQQEEPEA